QPSESHSRRPCHGGDWRWPDDLAWRWPQRYVRSRDADGGTMREPAHLRRRTRENESLAAGRESERPRRLTIYAVWRHARAASAEFHHCGAAGTRKNAL